MAREIVYQRCVVPYEHARRRRFRRHHVEARMQWPQGIEALRHELPKHLWNAPPPSSARRGSWAVLAMEGAKPIAFAWVTPTAGSRTDCYIEEVAVAPEHRGRHIGPTCVVKAASWMQQLGYNRIAITPLGWAETIMRLGFRHQGQDFYLAEIIEIVRRGQ